MKRILLFFLRVLLPDFLLGIVLQVVVAFLVLWKMMLVPGFVFHGDLMPSYYILDRLQSFVISWDYMTEAHLSPLLLPVLIFNVIFAWLGIPSELSIKLWLMMNYALAGSFIYFAVRVLLPKNDKLVFYSASVTASMTYMFTRMVITAIAVPDYILPFAAFPLAFVCFMRVLTSNRHLFIRYTALTIFALIFVTVYPPILFLTAMFILLYIIYRSLKYRNLRQLLSDFTRALFVLGMYLATFAFLFLPLLLSKSLAENTVQQYTQSQFSIQELYNFWGPAQGYTALNVLTLSLDYAWLWTHIDPMLKALSLLIPIIAFLSLIVNRRNRALYRITLLHAIPLCILLSFIIRDEPFIGFLASIAGIVWNSGIFLRGPLWSLMKQGSILMNTAIYFYSFLAGAFVYGILSWIKHKRLTMKYTTVDQVMLSKQIKHRRLPTKSILRRLGAVFLIIIVISPWIASAYPITGDVAGTLKPVHLPQEYIDIYQWLKERSDFHRVLWLPITYGHINFVWAGSNEGIPFETSNIPAPVLWRSDLVDYLYLQELLFGKSSHIGKVLSYLGVDYVVFHDDLAPQPAIDMPNEYSRVLNSLLHQSDLKLVYKNGFMYVFKNEEKASWVNAPSTIAIVVGGYETLFSLADLNSINLNNYALIFSDQLSSQTLLRLINATHIIFIGQHSSINDLLLQLADNYFIYPSNYLAEGWSGTSAVSLYLYYIYGPSIEKGYGVEWDGDILIGGTAAFSTTKGATLVMPVSLKEGNYELWARILMSPTSGSLEVRFSNTSAELINTYSPSAYFKWIKIENVNVTAKGDYVITLKNIKGVNAVNVVLLAPKSRLETLRDYLHVLLKDKLIVYIDKKFYEIPVLVDQENVPEEWVSQNYNISYLYAVNVYGNLSVAQTFIPTKPRLAGVEIWIGKWPQYIQPDLLVKLVPMGDEGPVLSDVLCEAKVSHEEVGYGFTFIKLNCTLTVGKSYAIVFSSPGNFSQSYLLYYPRTPFTYSGGYMLTSENNKTWHKSNYSLIFRTYYYSEPKQTFNLDKAEKSEVFLYRYNLNNNSYIPIESLPKPNESAEILSFSMSAPGKYVITLNTSRMFVLIVGEYDPLWTTNIKGAFIVPVLSTMNGYLINQTGVIEIIAEYSLNHLYNVGILISIVSLSVLFLLAIMPRYTYNKFAELRIQIKKLRRH